MKTVHFNFEELPIEEKHLAYYVDESSDTISLMEVVNAKYRHPEAPDVATITVIETRRRETQRKNSIFAAHIHLLKLASDNAHNVFIKNNVSAYK